MRTGFIVLFALFSLVGLLHSAAAIGAASPTVLDVTPSLISTFLAGRTANPNWPDGVGGGAYLDQPGWVTGCRGKLYFTDFRGIRSVDPLTGRVTTLIAASSSFRPLWCDGSFLYTSTTFNGGQLTIEQIDPDRLQTSTFSYPAIGSYTRGTVEFLMGIGDTLYTTDSASGRIWKIDLPTRNRTVIAEFGGPLITQNPLGSSRPPVLISAGAFWTDGSDIYIVRPQPNAPSLSSPLRPSLRSPSVDAPMNGRSF